MGERTALERELEQKTRALEERIKELQCLYAFAELVENPDASLSDIYQGLVELIPSSRQYPDSAGARLVIGDETYETPTYREDGPHQVSDVYVHGEKEGVLSVSYAERAPTADEGPFLAEERNLLDALAGRLGRLIERKRAEHARKELEYKERLMDELNHRVTNNLAMIGSLISLKDAQLGDTADLSDIQNQVEAVSFVHHKIYQVEGATCVDLRRYIEDFLSNVFSSYPGRAVEIENTIEDTAVASKTAVHLGLIVNELAMNAMKYGFSRESQPRFSVDLSNDGERAEAVFTVWNNGKPFPKDIDIENPSTFGLQLVNTLVEQLNGSLELQRTPSAKFEIRWPRAAEGPPG